MFVLALAGCATTDGGGWSSFDDGGVVAWLEHDAVPYFARTLTEHPRFSGEPVAVTIMHGERVATRSDELAIALRDRIHAALLETPNLAISLHEPGTPCTNNPRGYYLAVELVRPERAAARLHLRLYDAVEGGWVSGFSRRWSGRLTAEQARLASRVAVPDSARGARVLPFAATQSDLLAAQLAAKLACQLQRAGNDELLVQPARHRGAALVAGNLAARHAVPVGSAGVYGLDTRVHEVDRGLFQVWAILTPLEEGANLQSVVSDAYARAPLLRAPQSPGAQRDEVPDPVAAPGAPRTSRAAPPGPLVTDVSFLGPVSARDCERATPRHGAHGNRLRVAARDCFALVFEADRDARLYVVGRETDGSYVRVYPADCVPGGLGTHRGGARRFPARGAIAWDSRGGEETFYIIAARSREARVRLGALIDDLPAACSGDRNRSKQTGFAARLDAVIARLGGAAGYATARVHHATALARQETYAHD